LPLHGIQSLCLSVELLFPELKLPLQVTDFDTPHRNLTDIRYA
jgi:hypothetical protein